MSAVVVAALDVYSSAMPVPMLFPVAVLLGFPSPAQEYFMGASTWICIDREELAP